MEKANKLQSEIVKMRGLCEDLLTKNVDELKRSNNGKFNAVETKTY